MRHFAKEAEELGHIVRYHKTLGNYHDLLNHLCEEFGTVNIVEPAERSLRIELDPLIKIAV